MTRNLLNHFPYGMDPPMDYTRHSTRIGLGHESSRGFGMAPRVNPRTDPMARQHQQQQQHQHQHQPSNSHPATVQSNNAGPPRRRIPVACGRCRKRKIRCSGDPGDNTGCINCKNARVGQGVCVFMRVSSSTVDLNPYTSTSSLPGSGSGHGVIGLHAQGSFSTPTLHSTLGSQPSIRLGGHSLALSNGTIMNPRIYHHPADPMGVCEARFYGDVGGDISGSGDSPYSPYMLTSSDPGHSLGEASTVIPSQHQDFPRQWHMQATSGKSSGSSYYLEPEAPSGIGSISQVLTGYSNNSSRMSSSTNGSMDSYHTSSMFPALGSLSSSLPEGGSRSDKVLPPLPAARIPSSSDFGNVKLYSDVGSSDSPSTPCPPHPRSSTSTHRSPSAGYMPPSSLIQVPSSERPTPALSGSNGSISIGAYITPSPSLYSSNQQPLLSPSIIDMSGPSMPKQERQHASSYSVQSTPRSGAKIPAPPLCTSSTLSSAGYQQGGDHSHSSRGIGLSKVY